MINILATSKSAATVLSAMAGGAFIADAGSNVIGNESPITIGLAGAAIVLAFYLGGIIRGNKDHQRQTNRRLARIEHKLGITEGD